MIKSVLKALDIMELIPRFGGELSTTDIARKLELDVSTVHNLIKTLASREYLEQAAGTRAYSLGPALRRLAGGVLFEDELRTRCLPVAERLCHEINENVVVSYLRDGEWFRILRVEADQAVTVNVDRLRQPFYAYAGGRLLLAAKSREQREAVVRRAGLPGESWPEVKDLLDLHRELDVIHKTGSSIVKSDAGVTAMAVLMTVEALNEVVALSIYLPSLRLDSTREKALLEALLKRGEA